MNIIAIVNIVTNIFFAQDVYKFVATVLSTCYECGRYVHFRNAVDAYTSNGELVYICLDFCDYCYEKCEICGKLFHQDNLIDGVCNDYIAETEGESA